MKKIALSILGIAILVFFSISIHNNIIYRNHQEFASPLPPGMELVTRNDAYGKGYFGARRNGSRKHNGIDLVADTGIPVYAVRSGYVLKAENKKANGNYVKLDHGDNLCSFYLHLASYCVKEGQRVRQGQMIGRVGKTGNAFNHDMLPHLHFEVRDNGAPLNPMEDCLNEKNRI